MIMFLYFLPRHRYWLAQGWMQIPMEWIQIKPHQMSIPHFQFVFCDLSGSLNPVDMGSADLIITHGFTQNVSSMSNALQKSKCINRVIFFKLLWIPTKIQHQVGLIRSPVHKPVLPGIMLPPFGSLLIRSHMTLYNCSYHQTNQSLLAWAIPFIDFKTVAHHRLLFPGFLSSVWIVCVLNMDRRMSAWAVQLLPATEVHGETLTCTR